MNATTVDRVRIVRENQVSFFAVQVTKSNDATKDYKKVKTKVYQLT